MKPSSDMELALTNIATQLDLMQEDVPGYTLRLRASVLERNAREFIEALDAEERRIVAEAVAARDRQERSARAKFWNLAKKIGLDVEKMDERDSSAGLMVYPPEGLYPDERDDPHDGNHFAGTFTEALELAESYAAAVKAKSK